MLWLSYILNCWDLSTSTGSLKFQCVCVWAVCKHVNFFPEQGHWAFLGKPSATKLCFGRGSMTWSVMCTCEIISMMMKTCCGFFLVFVLSSCCFPRLLLESHDEILLLSCIMPLNVQSKCVSCGGCPTRCHRAGATTPCKCLPKPQRDSWIDVLYLAMVLLFCRPFRIASMSWVDFVTSFPALPAALVPRILSRCVICNMIVVGRWFKKATSVFLSTTQQENWHTWHAKWMRLRFAGMLLSFWPLVKY